MAQSKEFLTEKCSDLCALCVSVVNTFKDRTQEIPDGPSWGYQEDRALPR